ncbi:MAG: hypothetical protein Q8Q06_00220 [bacterium]|nr:hypothetical protein [bacterium]
MINQTNSFRFWLLAVAIFLVERFFPLFFSYPLFFSTAFIIVYMMRNEVKTFFINVIIFTAILDIFSGFALGSIFLPVIATLLIIEASKKVISISDRSFITTTIIAIIFTGIYISLRFFVEYIFARGSFDFEFNLINLILDNWLPVFIQTFIIIIVFNVVSSFVKNRKSYEKVLYLKS